VYAQNSTGEQDENSELATIPDPTNEEVGKYYGALKALCEQAAEAAMPGRTCSIRPGFIVGPGDSSDRFTSWPVRASKGGEMLAPGAPMDHVQVIDVRDLADFVIHSAENNLKGSYNAVGNPLRWGMVLPTPTKLTWVPPDFIEEHKVAPGGPELPIWVPSSGADAGFHTRSNARGVAAGLKFRPVRDTIDALLVWWPKEVARRDRVAKQLIAEAEAKGTEVPRFGDPNRPRSGLAPEKEAALLIAWHERESAPKPTPASSGK
jgi:2'-hydroxyisoflavone reductase